MSSFHRGSGDFLKRAYALSSAPEARVLYNEWATSYDKHLTEEEYAFPEHAASALIAAIDIGQDISQLRILDAGCGTGLVGIALSKYGAIKIDGLDISPGMLEIARQSGVYEELEEADLTKPIARGDGKYDAVLCVGTLTKGHVGPDPALSEFVRITKRGGFIVATVLDEIWESAGFRAKVDDLVSLGKVEIMQSTLVGVRKDAIDGGRMLVLKKL